MPDCSVKLPIFYGLQHVEMSSCAVNRWGRGTTCERPVNTEASKELQARMAAMTKERESQDKMWTTVTETEVPAKTAETPRSKQVNTTLK